MTDLEKRLNEVLPDWGYALVEKDMSRKRYLSTAFMKHVLEKLSDGCSHIEITMSEAHPAFIDERIKVIQ